MKTYLCLLALLLVSVWTIAQERPQHLTINSLVATGTTSEQTAMLTLVASHSIHQRATVRYTAGQSISLLPGFVAQAGSVFSATIGPVGSLPSASDEPDWSLRAYPNPFSGQTTLEYTLPTAKIGASCTLFDARGQVLRQSTQPDSQAAGKYHMQLDGSHLPPGVYIYQLEVGGRSRTIRLLKQ